MDQLNSSKLQDWSEVLSTFPARIATLTNFLHDRKFDKVKLLAVNLEVDLVRIRDWVKEEELKQAFSPKESLCDSCVHWTCKSVNRVDECGRYEQKFGPSFIEYSLSEIEEATTTGVNLKPEDLVPTMKLRWAIRKPKTGDSIPAPIFTSPNQLIIIQQWWLDRNVINPDGTAGGGRWVDVPVETE
jgi:hypothetical protein